MSQNKSLPVIYMAEVEYSSRGDGKWHGLEVSERATSKQNKLIEQLDNPKPKSLLSTWVPVPVCVERDKKAPDFYGFNSWQFGIASRARKALAPLLKKNVEFLPLKVVTERESDGDDIDEKECQRIEEYPELFVIHHLINQELSPNADVVYMDGTKNTPSWILHVENYAFDTSKLKGVHLFKATGDTGTLVSEEFVQVYEKHRLTGLKFKRLKYKEGGPKVEVPLPPPRPKTLVVAPVPLPMVARNSTKEMTDALWEKWTEQLDWFYRAMKARGMDVRKPRFGKPLGKKQLRDLQKKYDLELPPDFASVLERYASRLTFYWTAQRQRQVPAGELIFLTEDLSQVHPDDMPPQPFHQMFGEGLLWDSKRLGACNKQLRYYQHEVYPEQKDDYERAFRHKACFLVTGSGDMITLDVSQSQQSSPVVYLSHDGDETRNNRQLGESFIDFMTRCINLGCPDIEIWGYDWKRQSLIHDGKQFARWRRWLETGKKK